MNDVVLVEIVQDITNADRKIQATGKGKRSGFGKRQKIRAIEIFHDNGQGIPLGQETNRFNHPFKFYPGKNIKLHAEPGQCCGKK